MNFFGRLTRTDALRARRLGFESLERRDLLTIIRLVDWNTFNRPNDATDVANFETILAAIGNETLAGNTKRLDILAVQETDPASPGNNSIGQIEAILDGLYPSTNYSSVVSSVDGGGDSTGFVYDTSTVSLLESIEIAPGVLTHKVLRGKFRPESTLGESDFYVYSIHLKSGDGSSDVALRTNEALVLRNDADALGEGAHVLFVGDFNMKSSAEGAYTNLLAAGAGQLQDPINSPGHWYNNPAFKHLHTQHPGASMDDRFDMQLASGEFFDGVGLEYVDGSYHVFGNNGTHTFDGMITTGTGASPAVLAALAAASDHLPVIADYQLLDVTPGVRIVQTGGGTKVVEGGLYDTYNIVLHTIPTANVTVTVTPDAQVDVGNGAGVARLLVFTPTNALTPQAIVVEAVNDMLSEGNHTGLITHTSTSGDLDYDGLTIVDVAVAIVDNDAPTIVINEVDSDQESVDTAEFVELYDGGVGNVSLSGKTLVFFNGNGNVAYRVVDLSGHFTNADGFFVVGNSAVAGVGLVFPNNGLQNGEDAVALYAGPFTNGAAVTTTNLLDAIVYNNGQSDGAGLLVLLENGELSVNENQNSLGTTQSLSRVLDGGAPRRTSTYVAQSPTPGAPNRPPTAGVLITQSGTRVDVEEGGTTDSYQLSLHTIPLADVVITVAPDGQTDLGAGPGVAIVLTFTTANALIPQTVNVAAVDDMLVEGNHTSIITHTAVSADSAYNGLAIGNVVASVVDNDAAPPTSIVITEIMYNPASDESSPGIAEWIEVVNTGASAVDLGGWLFDDEDATNWGAIPAGTLLHLNQVAVFFDVAFTSAAIFRAEWSIPSSALVVGITWGSLANEPSATNEILELRDSGGTLMDTVNYDDTGPWPSISGIGGPSIYLKHVSLDNNAGESWARSTLGQRNALSPTGPTYSTADIGTPGWLPLAGDYNSNGMVDAADYTLWRDTLGSTTDARADGSGTSAGVPDGVVNVLDYDFWKASFGQMLVLGGGSGGGQRAMAAEGGYESQSLAAQSLPGGVEKDFAVDVALIELARGGVSSQTLAKAEPVARRLTALAADDTLLDGTLPDDTLLIVELRRSWAGHTGDGFEALPARSEREFDDVDDVFASLDDSTCIAGAAIFSH